MGKKLNLINKVFGRLTVINFNGMDKYGRSRWQCECKCGNNVVVAGGNLTTGQTTSCGCKRNDGMSMKATKHGMSRTPEYNSWRGMHKRCSDVNNNRYKDYGGRGIKVCSDWYSFESFYNDMGDRPKGTTLDRKNVNGDYCKENCKWTTSKEQGNNRRSNVLITYNGQTKTISQWSESTGINHSTIRSRFRRGCSAYQTLNPVIGKKYGY